jgi:hypothetical protein
LRHYSTFPKKASKFGFQPAGWSCGFVYDFSRKMRL